MDGEYVSNVERPGAYIDVDVRIRSDNLRETIDELNGILDVKEPAELVFPDEPDMTYFGIAEDAIEQNEWSHLGWHDTTISFKISDPHKYGPDFTRIIITDVGIVKYDATAEADPIIEITPRESITYVVVQNNNQIIKLGEEEYPAYTMIGKPADVEEVPYEKYQRIYHSNASDLVGWTEASNADIDGGVVDGNIVTRGGRFVVDSYGSGSNWHGPAIKRSLSKPLRDFRVSTFVGFMNAAQAAMIGRLEIYLQDANGNAIAKMALKDTSAARAAVFNEMRAGDRNNNDMIFSGFPANETGWNNFSGQLRIERVWDEEAEENVWSAYVALVDTSTRRHHGRRFRNEWRDGGRYSGNLAQIVIHMATVGDHTPVHENTGVSSIIVDEIVQEPQGIPYIAHEGDRIVLDSSTGDVYINEMQRNDLLDFGSNFIHFVKGDNQLVFQPSNLDKSVVFRDKYKL